MPPPVINENFIGVACCAIFQRKQNSSRFSLKLFINGDWVDDFEGFEGNRLESEHMWLCYSPCLLEAEEISWEFNWHSSNRDVVVYKRVGVHFMYKN